MEDLGNLYIPYPSIAEQHCIIDYIADKTQTIVQLLQQAYKQIELLKEYRQSLISGAVTGKIDVRNEGVARCRHIQKRIFEDHIEGAPESVRLPDATNLSSIIETPLPDILLKRCNFFRTRNRKEYKKLERQYGEETST